MNHESVRDLIPAYALGAVDPDERGEVEAHLQLCAPCRALLADYRLLADELLYTAPPVHAPRHLAADLRRRVAPTPRRSLWEHLREGLRPRSARVAGLVALVASLLLLFTTNLYWLTRVAEVEEQVAVQATAIAALAESPRVTLVGEAAAPDARGVLYFRPESKVAALHIYGLPPLEEGKVYQLWLIWDGQRESGGVFEVNEEGEGTLLIKAQRALGEYQAVEVTMEPGGGSPGPTSPRVIGGKL